MEKNYRFCEYHTLVSTHATRFPSADVCFAKITNRGVHYDKVYLYIAKDPNFGFPKRLKHNMLLTEHELHKLVRVIQSYCKFKCTITSKTHDGVEYYKLSIKFEPELKNMTRLFILTALRYAYEFPFNVICKDAFKLCENYRYQKRGFFNICNFIFLLIFQNDERTVHSLCDEYAAQTDKITLKKQILKTDSVNRTFNRNKVRSIRQINDFDNKKNDQDFWDNDFSERLNIYNQYIHKFKK
jgi:hypothetical protein